MKNKKWLLLFITVVICFAMPSIIYLAKNQSIYYFIYQWTFIFKIPKAISGKMDKHNILYRSYVNNVYSVYINNKT